MTYFIAHPSLCVRVFDEISGLGSDDLRHKDIGIPYEINLAAGERSDLLRPLTDVQGDLYGGMDIGRQKDLSVIWLIERIGDVKYTRMVKIMEKAPFRVQRDALFEILKHPRMRRFCIDSTGIGMQLAEEAQFGFGQYRVEAVNFSGPVKEELAYSLRNAMEDRLIYIPDEFEIREDFHSIRKITTAAGNIRFDVAATEARGHADRFWSCALANHAAGDKASGPITVTSRKRRESYEMLEGY